MLKSSRLKYRELENSDFEIFYEIYSSDSVMRYAYLDKYESREIAMLDFEKSLNMQNDGCEGTQYIALLKDSDIVIGIVDYDVEMLHHGGGVCEIGYFIKQEYWGQGFGAEMGKAMVDYLFENSPIHKISASCNSINLPSENIMKKLGMSKEGVFKKARFKNNRWEDEIKYALLREEWERQTKYLISACLVGVNCKYSGKNARDEKLVKLMEEGNAITICPEVLGELTIPRDPCEIQKYEGGIVKVTTQSGRDCTKEFVLGATKTLEICKIVGVKKAILQSRSPSCGYGKIYDGSFEGKLVEGNGLTADLLSKNGIQVFNENNWQEVQEFGNAD